MIFTITHRVECATPQKAVACRDACAKYLDEDDDVKVIQSDIAQTSRRYKVVGVDIAAKAPFQYDVEADSEQAAAEKTASKTRIIAEVSPQP